MKQCDACFKREFKNNLMCCQVGHLGFAFRKLLKIIPVIGKRIPDYKCKSYEEDITITGFQRDMPVNCRCAIHFSDKGDNETDKENQN